MPYFTSYCQQFSPLANEAMDALLQCARVKTYNKGRFLLKKGDVCSHLYFIDEGLIKAYFEENSSGKEFIMRFFAEGVMFTMFESYISRAPSSYRLVALENTTVTMVSRNDMERLCKEYHSVETFFRKLVSVAAVKMTKRIGEMLVENSKERYDRFVEENAAIMQRISLGDVAAYLGITRQSLSRIRAEKS